MTTRETLIAMLEPTVEALGYELVELEYRAASGRNGLVRVYIDAPDGVTLDDCETVSHEISALLDVRDPIAGQYTLEISSPGENRALRKRQHFEDYAGHRIRVELKARRQGRLRYTGQLLGVEDESVVLEIEDDRVRLSLGEIARARLAPERSGLSRP